MLPSFLHFNELAVPTMLFLLINTTILHKKRAHREDVPFFITNKIKPSYTNQRT